MKGIIHYKKFLLKNILNAECKGIMADKNQMLSKVTFSDDLRPSSSECQFMSGFLFIPGTALPRCV